jgi:hypothetical protein
MKSVKKEFWWDESNEMLVRRVWENNGATR